MTPQGIERLKKEAAAARKAAATLRLNAETYRGWGDAHSLAQAARTEEDAAWWDARAQLWETVQ